MAREISKALDERLQSGSAQSANSSSRRKPEFHYGNPFYAEEEDIAKRRTPEAKEEGMGKVGGMDAAARAIAHQILEEDEDALADFFSASKKRKAFRTHNPCRAGARYLVKALPDYFHGLDRSERQALSEKVAHILLKAKPKDFPGFMGGSFGGGGGGNSWNDYTNAIPQEEDEELYTPIVNPIGGVPMPQEPVKPTPIKTESPMKPKAPKAPAPVAAPAAPMEIDDSLLPIADMLVSDVAQDIWRQTGRDPSMKQVLAAIAKHPLLKKQPQLMPLVQRIVEERIGSDPLAGKNRQLFGRRNRAQYLMHEEAQPQTIMPTSIGPVGMPDISTLMTR